MVIKYGTFEISLLFVDFHKSLVVRQITVK